jgi:putative ABC transport system ATP-binding protein
MEHNLFVYIWRRTRREQLWILLVILLSMPANFALLDLPKSIVNGPIQGRGYEHGASQRLFAVSVPVPAFVSDSGALTMFSGLEMQRVPALFLLSGAFLALVIINGMFKYYINTYKGRLGERMLQVLRFELFDRILRFPPAELHRIKPAEIATMIKDEVEPLGGFIGDAFVQPFFLGGQIITSLAFIFIQNFWLGCVTVLLLAVQGLVIPRLRRRQLELSRQRQVSARALAGRIGEVIEDMPSIRSNDTANFQRADIVHRLTHVFSIRFALYQWKFFVKFLNNLLAQLTPFFFYAIGGYFATVGRLDLGQLVAVISAYKELPSPVKELIDWDQQRLDVEVKYHQVIDQFSAEGTLLPAAAPEPPRPLPRLTGDLVFDAVTVSNPSHEKVLDGLSFGMALTDIVALVNAERGGAEVATEAIAGLAEVDSGTIRIGGRSLADWPLSVTARRISYAGPEPFFPQSTLLDALVSGLKFAVAPEEATGSLPKHLRIIEVEGVDLDFDRDWIDYAVAGSADPGELYERIKAVLLIVDLDNDAVSWGLDRQLDPRSDSEPLRERLVAARGALRSRLKESGLTHFVEPFDPDTYCHQATIFENILFGAPRGDADKSKMIESAQLQKFLAKQRLDSTLFGIGREIAETVVEVFSGINADNRLFAQQALMPAEEFADYDQALKRLGPKATFEMANRADRLRFIRLALNYIEPRDRLGLLDAEVEARLVTARKAFRAELGSDQRDVVFYDPQTYNPASSIQENILLGRVAFGVASANDRVNGFVRTIVDDLGLRDVALKAGLTFDIGASGKRLSRAQRQKLSMARALLRRPDLLVSNGALSALDGLSQAQVVDRVLARARGEDGDQRFGVVWAMASAHYAEHFDRVLLLDHGKLVETAQAAK